MKFASRNKFLTILAFSLLFLIASASMLSLLIRQKQKNEINGALAILRQNSLPLEQVDKTLGILFSAEMEFRKYTINYDKTLLNSYREHIRQLTTNISTLKQIAGTFRDLPPDKAIETLKERERQAGSYLRLKKLADSLLTVAISFDSVSFTQMDDNFYLKAFKPSQSTLSIDTLDFAHASGKKNKGLLGKIKTFLVGEETQTTSNTKVVVKSGAVASAEVPDTAINLKGFATDIINKTNQYYHLQLKKQLQQRKELRIQELKLVNLNNNLLGEIRQILNVLKQTSQQFQQQQQSQSSQTIAISSGILQNTLLAVILISFLLAIYTMVMLRKNQRYQQQIFESQQKSLLEAEEKSRFLSYMSHEFRTPLASVIGFAEQIEQTKLDAEQKNYLSGLMSSSDMLLATVNDILDLSQLEAGKMSFLCNPFRPDDSIHQVLKSFLKMASDKNLTLTYRHNGKALTLLGDEIRLKQVMNNLISNALKYTRQGEVTIASRINTEAGIALLSVDVSDTGIGIDPEKIGQIFDDFSRVHTGDPEKWIIGTGLGLAVTKRLIDQMGGTVNVSSLSGQGSVFSITIPYPVSSVQPQSASVAHTQSLTLPENVRILVADDNYFNVILLQSIFKRENVLVDVAENGFQAIEKLKSGNYHILLSDMYMPQMDGIELTRQIRGSNNDWLTRLPIIMLTGNISPDASQQMKKAGVSDFLIKPYQRKDLIALVIKHLSEPVLN